MGIGGGGDVIQGIPIANLMRQLGVKKVFMGGVSCQWWTPDGNPLANEWGSAVMGPTVYPVSDLQEAELVAPHVALVNENSNYNGKRPCEARLASLIPAEEVFVAGLSGGVIGLARSLNQLIADERIDLFVGVDIGSDSFHDGKEASPAKTSLVDFISLGAITRLECPTIYGVSGYGCDGEMQLEELDERVSRVMKAGGYLGAHGLTQQDVLEMERASEAYPDPIEPMSYRAARGEFGFRNVWTNGPYGTVVKVTPLASVMMLFDPDVLGEVCSTGIADLVQTESLEEAEEIYREKLGQFPESRMHHVIDFFRTK
tara:strand:- start:15136 stop:16080 length:945 start_codon:yes stop_codon:yes gene_type:complete